MYLSVSRSPSSKQRFQPSIWPVSACRYSNTMPPLPPSQQRREVGPRQAVEMDFALGVDLLVQRIVRVHAGIVGVGLARGHAPHRDLLAAAQLRFR